jgi:hypothetical protein
MLSHKTVLAYIFWYAIMMILCGALGGSYGAPVLTNTALFVRCGAPGRNGWLLKRFSLAHHYTHYDARELGVKNSQPLL